MLRTSRDITTSPELDALEHAWWNDNAATVSRVWEMEDEVCRAVRSGYLARARALLMRGRPLATVLELGCGSGWVGQQIAGDGLSIVGADFSEAQLELARARARRSGLEAHCRYELCDSRGWTRLLERVDGVIVHCVLHHLSGKEVQEVLEGLRRGLPPGTPVWIYEPAFHVSALPPSPAPVSRTTSFWLSLTGRVHAYLGRAYRALGLLDESAAGRLLALTVQAERSGWYLSPKEVPFDRDAFTRELEQHFRTGARWWATVSLVSWAHDTNLLTNWLLRRLAAAIVLPLFRHADALLAREEEHLKSALAAPSYAFHVWECTTPDVAKS